MAGAPSLDLQRMANLPGSLAVAADRHPSSVIDNVVAGFLSISPAGCELCTQAPSPLHSASPVQVEERETTSTACRPSGSTPSSTRLTPKDESGKQPRHNALFTFSLSSDHPKEHGRCDKMHQVGNGVRKLQRACQLGERSMPPGSVRPKLLGDKGLKDEPTIECPENQFCFHAASFTGKRGSRKIMRLAQARVTNKFATSNLLPPWSVEASNLRTSSIIRA